VYSKDAQHPKSTGGNAVSLSGLARVQNFLTRGMIKARMEMTPEEALELSEELQVAAYIAMAKVKQK